jgi:formate--tetrahydrofolate ligase
VVGYSKTLEPILAKDLKAHGAMAVLLKQAFAPNLVQTLENNLAIIHGGPFANIAHGCNSVMATQTALKLADYVVTEAGFGSDLGAEKFIDIKCRKSGLQPSAVVMVATVRALKFHGGVALADLGLENLSALTKGFVNLERHIRNMREVFGLPCVVAINHRSEDTDAEIELLKSSCAKYGVEVILAKHWAEGGAGATQLAQAVVQMCEAPSTFKLAYDDTDTLWDKINAVATKIYGASSISMDSKVKAQLQKYQESGYGHFPVCIAKTQYSFSTDPSLKGAPSGHVLNIREVRLSAGAQFVVAICGEVMTMPGLPAIPSAESIDINESGRVVGLF